MIYTQSVLNINLDSLVKNFSFLKDLAPHSIPAAVVKNNAYGIGVENVVPTLLKSGCNHFFVALADEGATVRAHAPHANIFVLQGIGDDSIEVFKKFNLTPVIATPHMFEFWKKNKISGIRPVLNIDTGLNRLGFRFEDIQNLSSQDKNEFSFILSHLACADEAFHFMNRHQSETFDKMTSLFPHTPTTLSASDGVFLGESFQKDMVRFGAAMYGLNTAPDRKNRMLPVVTLKAPVLQIINIHKGEYIGYGATYKAAKNMKIAVVSIGYGDGIPRSLSDKGRFFYEGEETRFVGRLSMDNIMCDISHIHNISEGDFVDVLNDSYTADDMGRDAGTIGYEILSSICKSPRLKRVYLSA